MEQNQENLVSYSFFFPVPAPPKPGCWGFSEHPAIPVLCRLSTPPTPSFLRLRPWPAAGAGLCAAGQAAAPGERDNSWLLAFPSAGH